MKVRLAPVVLALLAACQMRDQLLRLPSPPQQRAPWIAPANLPTNLLSAVNTLFAQGFPDPRGCEYREIEVVVSSVWEGRGRTVQTRGWILPAKSGTTQHFAICWNGLIYPVSKIGAPADLPAEVADLPASRGRRLGNAAGEIETVVSTHALSTRVLLLLRCGETETALRLLLPDEELLSELRAQRRDATGADLESYDPYLQLAGDWAWALFDRTICAHMRGDDALALATARTLAEVQPKIEAEAARRGFPRQKYFEGTKRGQEKPYLDFLDQFPQLLADLERRAREGPRVSTLERGLTNMVNQSARIRALIRDLDLVQARQWGQPGSVNPAGDPIVAALIREGDAAVEPLLDCMETDKRLTRSVSFHRDFFRSRRVVPVSSAARAAVRTILQFDFQNAAEARAYWKKYKGQKLEERWYAMLKDDSAGMGRWQEAAANITRPENVMVVPGTGFQMTKPAPTNQPVHPRGEVLRGKSNPSVSELLARRALEVVSSGDAVSYDLAAACEIGLCLAAWDAPAAGPVARELVKRCRTAMEYSSQRSSWPVQRLGSFFGRLTMARVRAGDAQALEDYAAWLQTVTPEQLDTYLSDSLEPLRVCWTNSVLQATAERLFGNTNSAWGTLPWKGAHFFNPAESELVNLPAFRRLLSRQLDRKEVCGTITWHEPATVGFEISNYVGGSRGLALPEDERPPNGTRADLRWCDWIALSLFNAKQIPSFNPFAPVEKRDEAIGQAKALLEQNR